MFVEYCYSKPSLKFVYSFVDLLEVNIIPYVRVSFQPFSHSSSQLGGQPKPSMPSNASQSSEGRSSMPVSHYFMFQNLSWTTSIQLCYRNWIMPFHFSCTRRPHHQRLLLISSLLLLLLPLLMLLLLPFLIDHPEHSRSTRNRRKMKASRISMQEHSEYKRGMESKSRGYRHCDREGGRRTLHEIYSEEAKKLFRIIIFSEEIRARWAMHKCWPSWGQSSQSETPIESIRRSRRSDLGVLLCLSHSIFR